MSVANPLEQQMLTLINQERAAVGAPPLTFNGDLNQSSEVHSQWMLEQDQFSHTGAGGSSAKDRMADAGYPFEGAWASGENIAFQSLRGAPGLEDDVVDLHQSLMDSPGHRANILNPDYTEVGIGLEEGVFTSNGTDFDSLMVTQNFATTDAVLDAPETVPDADPDPEVVAEAPVTPPVVVTPPVEPDPVEEPPVVDVEPEVPPVTEPEEVSDPEDVAPEPPVLVACRPVDTFDFAFDRADTGALPIFDILESLFGGWAPRAAATDSRMPELAMDTGPFWFVDWGYDVG